MRGGVTAEGGAKTGSREGGGVWSHGRDGLRARPRTRLGKKEGAWSFEDGSGRGVVALEGGAKATGKSRVGVAWLRAGPRQPLEDKPEIRARPWQRRGQSGQDMRGGTKGRL